MIAIINFGMGNLNSIKNKLERHRIESVITNDMEVIENADKLILPGVGHFKKGMENLHKFKLIEVLNKSVINQKKPIFGICLGMQLFAKSSEEGNVPGLGWISGYVKKFSFRINNNYKIPHVGWNNIQIIKNSHLLKDIVHDQLFYFTHSYYLECMNEIIIAETDYGHSFPSVISHKNISGVQFHPEKSHKRGFQMLLNFCK